MLRFVVAVLVVANLLVLGWTRGVFAPGFAPPRQGEREPERLSAQLRADALVLLPTPAASAVEGAARGAANGAANAAVDAAAASAAASGASGPAAALALDAKTTAAVCLEAGPFAPAVVQAAEAALAAAQPASGAWARETVNSAAMWLVYAGRFAEAAARRKRHEELTRLGLNVDDITQPPELAPGLALGHHDSRAAAEAAMASILRVSKLRGLRVVEQPAPPPVFWLRVPAADAELAARLQALPAQDLGEGFKACATPEPRAPG